MVIFEKMAFSEIKEVWLSKMEAFPKLRKRLVKFMGAFYWQEIPKEEFN